MGLRGRVGRKRLGQAGDVLDVDPGLGLDRTVFGRQPARLASPSWEIGPFQVRFCQRSLTRIREDLPQTSILRVIACIEDPPLIRKILGQIQRREALSGIAARGPPPDLQPLTTTP
jgi:hypothetical protein